LNPKIAAKMDDVLYDLSKQSDHDPQRQYSKGGWYPLVKLRRIWGFEGIGNGHCNFLIGSERAGKKRCKYRSWKLPPLLSSVDTIFPLQQW